MDFPCDHCGTAAATIIDGDAGLWCAPCFDQERAMAPGYAHAVPPLSFNLRAVQRVLEDCASVLHLPAKERPYQIALVEYERKWAARLGIDISPP